MGGLDPLRARPVPGQSPARSSHGERSLPSVLCVRGTLCLQAALLFPLSLMPLGESLPISKLIFMSVKGGDAVCPPWEGEGFREKTCRAAQQVAPPDPGLVCQGCSMPASGVLEGAGRLWGDVQAQG